MPDSLIKSYPFVVERLFQLLATIERSPLQLARKFCGLTLGIESQGKELLCDTLSHLVSGFGSEAF